MEDRNLKPLGRLGRTSRCGKSERTKVYFFFPESLTGLQMGGTTMAILNGINKMMTGSAGQQHQRMKWVNIIRMYSGIYQD